LGPSFLSEVEPEEPKVLDTETNQCSAADMKFTRIQAAETEALEQFEDKLLFAKTIDEVFVLEVSDTDGG